MTYANTHCVAKKLDLAQAEYLQIMKSDIATIWLTALRMNKDYHPGTKNSTFKSQGMKIKHHYCRPHRMVIGNQTRMELIEEMEQYKTSKEF